MATVETSKPVQCFPPNWLEGLVEPCDLCPGVRDALYDFLRSAVGLTLEFPARDPNTRHHVHVEKTDAAWSKVICPKCLSTGFVLTDHGRALVWMISVWLAAVKPEWQRGLEEIPF